MIKCFYNLLIYVFIVSCTSKNKAITIAGASSMQFVLKDLVAEFKLQENTNINVITGSSGKLTAQIERGAPFDIFFSANKKYPDYLVQKLKLTNTSLFFAKGRLVFFSTTKLEENWEKSLLTKKITKIALPNPQFAPYGKAANEVLQSKRLTDKLSKKLVLGESVMQTNQFVLSGAANMGFTSLSTIKSSKINIEKIYWELVPDSLHKPITHTFLKLNTSNTSKQHQMDLFSQFLISPKGKKIIKKHGYIN